MFVFFDNAPLQNTMAEQNVPNHPPTRTDEQIVPRSQWLNNRGNIDSPTSVPAIYLQQFWKTMQISDYSCQPRLNPFELPPSGDTVLDFERLLQVTKPRQPSSVNAVGKSSLKRNADHAELIWEEFYSRESNIFLQTTKSKPQSQSEEPKKKELLSSYLWTFSKVIIYYLASHNNIPSDVLILLFITQKDELYLGNLKFVPKGESVECLECSTRIYSQREDDDPDLELAKKLSLEAPQEKGEGEGDRCRPGTATSLQRIRLLPRGRAPKWRSNNQDPVVKATPKLHEMVVENTKKTPQESASVQPVTQRATPKKPTTTTPVKQTKPAPPPSKKPSKRKLPQKVRKGKPTFQLVDEDDEAQQESNPQEEAIKLSLDPSFLPQGRAPVGGVTIRDPVSETTPKLHEVVGKGKAVVTEEQVAHSLIDMSKKKRTTDQFILARRDQTPPDSTTGPSSQHDDDTSEKVIHESSSTSDSERTESETETAAPKDDKDQGEVDSSTVTSGVSIPVSDPVKAHEALAGPDPEPMKEDQTGSDSGKLHVSLAGPNPEHMDDEFLATAYPKVHENLKLITDERVIDDKPESHSGSMSSMKNLDDSFNFGDQFLHDKPTEDDQEKSKVREESDSTIPDSSHQTVTSTPPVIVPFTEVSSSKPSLLVTPPPINTEATTIKTSLFEITPFIALQLRVARLEQEMSEVKKTDLSADVLASIRSQTQAESMYSDVDVDNDDDEGPSAGSNQGVGQTREKEISIIAAYGSANTPMKLLTKRTGKKKLCKADLEGPAFNLAKAFHKNSVFLQYQMDECHKLLTNKVDWMLSMASLTGGLGGRNSISTNTVSPDVKQSGLQIANSVVSIHSIFMKAQPSAQDRQDQSSHSSQHVDKKPGDPESCGRLTARDG
ncbi:hypothetical protein Tco_0465364 [Tanacetum coccineum]